MRVNSLPPSCGLWGLNLRPRETKQLGSSLNTQWALGLTQHSKKETETPYDQAEKPQVPDRHGWLTPEVGNLRGSSPGRASEEFWEKGVWIRVSTVTHQPLHSFPRFSFHKKICISPVTPHTGPVTLDQALTPSIGPVTTSTGPTFAFWLEAP